MNGITVRDGEPLEKYLRRFTKTCERSGVLSDLKRYRHYEKPSEEKKRKNNAVKQRLKRDRKMESLGYERKAQKR